jgi:hypothetical protein
MWAPLGGVLTTAVVAAVAAAVVAVVVAGVPSVADPGRIAGATPLAAPHTGGTVPGAGGYGRQVPIRLAAPPSPANPLRVTILGDSVMHDASFGIRAALESTGEGAVGINTIDGFGLTTATGWPQEFPQIVKVNKPQLVVATWSWDDFGPSRPNALHQSVQYARLLHRAVATLLAHGNGVEGVIFTQFPLPDAPVDRVDPQRRPAYRARINGAAEWNRIAQEMTRQFPGHVMYLPLGGSLTWHGKFAAWLPPHDDPHTPLDQWVRVRKLDVIHLCAEGVARYAEALLTDMTALFKLAPASPEWAQGPWRDISEYNTPPGSCPDDHPPSYSDPYAP